MSESHYLCPRCGVILVNYSNQPDFCPKCGGVQIVDIGAEGEYTVKDVRKKYHAPFRRDIFYEKED